MASIGSEITKAAKILRNGGLVGIPTETVYGLAANALDPEAVARIFEVKKRPFFDPLIVHTSNLNEMQRYVHTIPEEAEKLARKFWPGPLTLLLDKNPQIPDLVTAGMHRVAIRIPDHKITLGLLDSLEFPLVAPSANPFGYVSPTTAIHVEKQLGKEIDYILDGGRCHVGIESTIIGFDEGKPTIYRLGGLAKEQIEEEVGKLRILPYSSSNPETPGMLKSHYAPVTKVVTGEIQSLIHKYKDRRIAILRYQPAEKVNTSEKAQNNGSIPEVVLSKSGDVHEAAKNLFAALRNLDELGIDLIIAEKAPQEGLGLAINDRLERASV